MIQFRDNRHKALMRHGVTTRILCLHSTGAAVICAVIVKVAPGKEAAP